MALPIISISRATTTEYSNLLFNVTLSEPSEDEITFEVVSMQGTAALAGEVQDFTQTIKIPAGQDTVVITIRTYHDTVDEVDESFFLRASNAKGAVFSNGEPSMTVLGFVLDDDGSGSNLALAVSNPTIVEGNGGTKLAVFELVLSQPYSGDLTLAFTTMDGSAKAGSDYTAKSGTVTFLAGETTAQVEVAVKGDTTDEFSEFFSLVVTPDATIKSGAADTTGIATILDNDTGNGTVPVLSIDRAEIQEYGTLRFAVTLSRATDEEVTVDYAFRDGTLTSYTEYRDLGGTLTIPAGATTGYISVATGNDREVEADETVFIDLFNAKSAILAGGEPILSTSGVVHDDDGTGSTLALSVGSPVLTEGNAGNKIVTFEVRLSEPYGSDLSIPFRTVDGSATAGADYGAKSGSVTFKAGQTVATVEVAVRGDTTQEGTEFFSLVLDPPPAIKNGVLGAAGTATIVDNDTGSGSLPVLSLLPAETPEYNSMDFTVILSRPSDVDITVKYQTIAETATIDNEFRSVTGTLTIPAGDTVAVISVPTYHDRVDEVDEAFALQLFAPTGAVLAGGEKTLSQTGIILDDDGTGSNLSLFVSDAVVTEGDSGSKNAVFEITLSSPHATDLTLSYKTVNGTASAGSDYLAKSGTVTFLAGQTKAAVLIPVYGDHLLENNETFSLVVTPTLAIKNGTAANTGIATIFNNDDVHELIYGTAGNNTIRCNTGNDKAWGNGGNDKLYGDSGNDTLYGGTGVDQLFGGAGKDALVGGAGRDILSGGSGSDRFIYKSLSDSKVQATGRDVITDFTQKADRIDLSAIDAKTGAGNQAFSFIGDAAFSGTAGELRFSKTKADTYVYADVNGDKAADFAIHLTGSLTLKVTDFVL